MCYKSDVYINQKYGYDIYETIVGRSRHFFNIDNNDKIIDITVGQFDTVVDYENIRRREFKELLKSADTKSRYELFMNNLNHELLYECNI